MCVWTTPDSTLLAARQNASQSRMNIDRTDKKQLKHIPGSLLFADGAIAVAVDAVEDLAQRLTPQGSKNLGVTIAFLQDPVKSRARWPMFQFKPRAESRRTLSWPWKKDQAVYQVLRTLSLQMDVVVTLD